MDALYIKSLEELRARYGSPTNASVKKQSPRLNSTYQQWLAHASFFVIASVGPDGVDCTPRGDKHGDAFSVADDKTILIPDRRGNNRLDTLSNLVADPRIALLFFIPGIDQAVRVVGTAKISIDNQLLDQFILDGKPPLACIVVDINAVYFQNSRALARSELWSAERVATSDVPTPEQMLKSVSTDHIYDELSDEAKNGNE